MIKIRNLSKTYTDSIVETQALQGIDLDIDEGEFVAIIGKSGCGKSTLLNIMGGMDQATSGEYYFDDVDVRKLKDADLAKFRNKTIGFVFQAFNLINEINLIENVAVPLGYRGVSKRERDVIAEDMLEIVGLKKEKRKKPTELSGGQKQRVAFARAIANEPRVILADEPTGNLDQKNSREIVDLLHQAHKNGTTIVMVTHDMDLAKEADRIIEMEDGKIIS